MAQQEQFSDGGLPVGGATSSENFPQCDESAFDLLVE